MVETHNIYAFTNRATEYEKRMDDIKAYVEGQQKFDLENDFSFQARYMRYGHSINHSIQSLLIAKTHNIYAFTNRATEFGKRMDEIEAYVERQ